jgi:hypothetical protein
MAADIIGQLILWFTWVAEVEVPEHQENPELTLIL